MKKVLKLGMVFIIIGMFMIGNVYAMKCNTSIESQKTEFEVNEEFKVDFCISDIESNRGVIALQAILEYDKDSLTLIKMEGKNGWETPIEGVSYNKENGKIAIVRNGTGKSNEVILSITFKVEENAKQNPSINLKDIAIADGDGMAKFAKISKNITVKADKPTDTPSTEEPADKPSTDKPTDTPSTDKPAEKPADTPGTEKPAEKPSTEKPADTPNTEKPADKPSTEKPVNTPSYDTNSDKTTSNEKLPQTGIVINFVVTAIFIVAILIGTYSFIKMKKA